MPCTLISLVFGEVKQSIVLAVNPHRTHWNMQTRTRQAHPMTRQARLTTHCRAKHPCHYRRLLCRAALRLLMRKHHRSFGAQQEMV